MNIVVHFLIPLYILLELLGKYFNDILYCLSCTVMFLPFDVILDGWVIMLQT